MFSEVDTVNTQHDAVFSSGVYCLYNALRSISISRYSLTKDHTFASASVYCLYYELRCNFRCVDTVYTWHYEVILAGAYYFY